MEFRMNSENTARNNRLPAGEIVEIELKGLKQLFCGSNHNPTNFSGIEMSYYTDGETLFSWVNVPERLSGWKNLAHGGIITTILDEIMGWWAIYQLKSVVLTKSISIDFVKPTPVGNRLRAEGRFSERPHEREVVMEGFLFTEERVLCAKAKGIFAVFAPDAAEKLGLMDENMRSFLDLIKAS